MTWQDWDRRNRRDRRNLIIQGIIGGLFIIVFVGFALIALAPKAQAGFSPTPSQHPIVTPAPPQPTPTVPGFSPRGTFPTVTLPPTDTL